MTTMTKLTKAEYIALSQAMRHAAEADRAAVRCPLRPVGGILAMDNSSAAASGQGNGRGGWWPFYVPESKKWRAAHAGPKVKRVVEIDE